MFTNFLMNLFLLFPQVAVQQPAGNEPVWLLMPTATIQERAAREVVRKDWLKRKRILEAMAVSAARKQRLNARYQARPQTTGQRYYYYYRTRPINIQTPSGTITYWVPY